MKQNNFCLLVHKFDFMDLQGLAVYSEQTFLNLYELGVNVCGPCQAEEYSPFLC